MAGGSRKRDTADIEASGNNADIMAAIKNLDEKFTAKFENLEAKIGQTVQQSIHDELTAFKNEFNQKLQDLERRIQIVENKPTNNDSENRKLNFIVRGLPESENENVKNKVMAMIKDGLKLKDTVINKAVRKASFRANTPGIVVVTCENLEDKEVIMKGKVSLRKSRQYKEVFVDHDKSREQRLLESNLRLLVESIGKDKLSVKGSRLCRPNNDENNEPQPARDNNGRRARHAPAVRNAGNRDEQPNGRE